MILYFYGPNSYLIRQTVNDLKKKYVNKSGNDFNLLKLDMSEAHLSELVDAITTQPLLAHSRLVIVQNLSSNKIVVEKIKEIIRIVPESTILVIEESEPDRRSAYFKYLVKNVQAKEFIKLPETKLIQWIKDGTKKLGGNIEPSVVKYLIQKIGDDMWQLKNEIDKLVSYQSQITIENIDRLVVPNMEQTIFELTDAVADKNLKKAMGTYKNLGIKGVSDQQILAMLNWQYRNLVLAFDNLGRGRDWANEFGISSFVASKSTQLAAKVEMNDLKKAYRKIVAADLSIKTGQKDSNVALEELILKLVS
ncbi:MAG: DNA polymerase III subunit delta [bacterium]|nr:DNA polymerase III subunit delta [bacterium]